MRKKAKKTRKKHPTKRHPSSSFKSGRHHHLRKKSHGRCAQCGHPHVAHPGGRVCVHMKGNAICPCGHYRAAA
jgi:hypothetical protein